MRKKRNCRLWLTTGAFTTAIAQAQLRKPSASLFCILAFGMLQLAAGLRVLVSRRPRADARV